MNFIKKGIDWLEGNMVKHTDEPVTLIQAGGSTALQATVIEPESRTSSDGVRTQSDTFTFLFRDGLPAVKRGDKIIRTTSNTTYEVVIERGTITEYNDPVHNRQSVRAKIYAAN